LRRAANKTTSPRARRVQKAKRDRPFSTDGKWRSFPKAPNLLQDFIAGTYYARCKVDGKPVRESLQKQVFTLAKLRLPNKRQSGAGGRHIDRLIAAINPLEGRAIIVPTRRGKRGNPVLWSKRFFVEMAELAGDVGAKHLIGEHAELVAEVEMDDDAVLIDIDTPEALAALQQGSNPAIKTAC